MRDDGSPAVGRVFLVGCPRSGTTLLQSLLAAHPDVVSLPETFFFAHISPTGRRGRLGLAPRRAAAAVADLDALGLIADPRPSVLPMVTIGGYASHFVRRLDRAAHEAGASLWLEKTPRHARYVDLIAQHVPGARFVHIVRSGEAVVASLQAASEQDPVVWPPGTPLHAVSTWRRYLGYTSACVGRPGHAFVSYERLVAAPDENLRRLCDFLGLRLNDEILDEVLSGYRASATTVIGRLRRPEAGLTAAVLHEPWKHDVGGQIANRNETKFRRVFDEDQQTQLRQAVAQERATLATIPFL